MKNPSTLLLALALGLPAAARADLTTGMDSISMNTVETTPPGAAATPPPGVTSVTDLLKNKTFLVDAKNGTVAMSDLTNGTNSAPVALTKTGDPVVVAYNDYLSRQQPQALSKNGLSRLGAAAPTETGAPLSGNDPTRLFSASARMAATPDLLPLGTPAPTGRGGVTTLSATQNDPDLSLKTLGNAAAGNLTSGMVDPTTLGKTIGGSGLMAFLTSPNGLTTNQPGRSTPGNGLMVPAVRDGANPGDPLHFTPTFNRTAAAAAKFKASAASIQANLTPGAAPNVDDGSPTPLGTRAALNTGH
jgi:hypothetical protein